MSEENNTEALFAMQDALESIHKLLESRFPKAAQKAKAALDEAKKAKTAAEAQKAAQRFSRTISDISNDDLKEFSGSLDDASKSTKSFGSSLASGGKKAMDGLITTITASIPVIGGLIGAAINEVLRSMTQSLEAERAGLGEAFRSLGDGTVEQGLTNLRNQLEITYQGMIDIMAKHSSGIGVMGAKNFADTVVSLKNKFVTLGYSVEEGTEAVARFAEEQSYYLSVNRLSQAQQTKMMFDQMKQVSSFSNALKLSREEVERQMSIENETAENKMYLAQLTEEQLNAYKAAKASVGEALALEAVGAIRNEKLYGTAAASETYRGAMASGTNDRIDSVADTIMAGNNEKFLDEEYISGLSALSETQLRMASLLSDNTEYQQNLFFESSVHLSETAAKLSHVVDAYLTAEKDDSVKAATEVENTIPYLLGLIQEQVRAMAMAVTDIDFGAEDSNTAEGIKKMRDKLGSVIKSGGDTMVSLIKGIRNAAENIYNFLKDGKFMTAAKFAAKYQPAQIVAGMYNEHKDKLPTFLGGPGGKTSADKAADELEVARATKQAKEAAEKAAKEKESKTTSETLQSVKQLNEEYAKRTAIAVEVQNVLLAENNRLTEKMLKGGSGFVS